MQDKEKINKKMLIMKKTYSKLEGEIQYGK